MTTSHNLPIEHPVADPVADPVAAGWLPLAVVLTGTFLVVLDFFIVNVALPSLQDDLHAGATAVEWLVAGYGLTFGSLLLAASRLGARWGRRPVYAAGVALFVLASAACGAAPGVDVLIAARLVQGVGAALLTPMVLALIGDLYDGPRRLRALGIYATVLGVAAASGQLVGGLLITADPAGLGWRSVFLVNVPIGALVLLAVRRTLPAPRPDRSAHVDLTGAALAVAGTTALMLPLLEGRQLGWPVWTWFSLAGGAALLLLFAHRLVSLAARGGQPLVAPGAFAAPAARRGLVCQALLFSGMASYFLVLALYLQDGRGLGPLASGIVFTVVAGPYMLGTSIARRIVERTGRWGVAIGAAGFAAGHLATIAALSASDLLVALLPGLALAGLGMGVCLSALVATVMARVRPVDAAGVSGAMSSVQQLGNAAGVALIGIVFFATHDVSTAFSHSLWILVAAMTALAGAATAFPERLRD